MKTYLITVKRNDTIVAQSVLAENDALNLVRKAFAKVYEETSADIKAINVFSDIEKSGKAKAIEYNGAKMVVQIYNK